MITLQTPGKRVLIIALMFSLLALISSCEQSVFVSNQVSEPRELAAYECDSTAECDETMAALAAELKLSNECAKPKPPPYCFETFSMSKIRNPTPCPTSQCLPFWKIPRVRFYSDADTRPVEIFVNNKFVGRATDESYDVKTKMRTVYFDLKKNFKIIEGQTENVMSVKIPVTYPVVSADGRPTGERTQSVLDIAANF